MSKFRYKSDQEPAIKVPIEIQFEESGVSESQQYAQVELATWEVDGMARTLAFAAEELHKTSFPFTHTVCCVCH